MTTKTNTTITARAKKSCFAFRRHIGIVGALNYTTCGAGQYALMGSASCTNCAAGTYSAQSGQSTCLTCPIGSYCQVASTQPTVCAPNTHNHLSGQTACFACPQLGRCLGGASCLTGYQGPLCGQCASRYFALKDECKPCPDVKWFLIIFLSLITPLLVMFVLVRIPPIFVTRGKQLITFVQSLSLVLTISIDWPALVEWIKSILSAVYLDIQVASPECLVSGGMNWHDKFLIYLLLAGVIPLIILCLVGVIAVFRKRLSRLAFKKSIFKGLKQVEGQASDVDKKQWNLYLKLTKLQIRVSRLLFLVISIAYVPLTQTAVKAFVCMNSPIGSVLVEDTSILCSSPTHLGIQVVAVLVLIFVTILLPVVLGVVPLIDLWRLGKEEGYRRLDRREVLSAVFESYHPSHVYFEGIVMAKKAIFVVIIVSVTGDYAALTQSVLLSVFSAIYLVVVIKLRPFAPIPIAPSTSKIARPLVDQCCRNCI